MYKPAPPRPRRTGIVRARTGCKGCRQRRTKCDEKKPSCGTCVRLGRSCEQVSPKLQFRNLTLDLACESYDDESQIGQGEAPRKRRHVYLPPSVNQHAEGSSQTHDGSCESTDSSQAYSPSTSCSVIEPPSSLPIPLPLVPTAPRDPIAPILFYAGVWKQKCLPAIHQAFYHLHAGHGQLPITADLTVALSACRLSRTLPQRKSFKASSIPGLCFRPDASHESISREYYNAAISKVVRWGSNDFEKDPLLGLTTLVIFCYLESSIGNFREFRVHSNGIKQLAHAYMPSLVRASLGTELLAAWVEVEMQNWWRRAYFCIPGFYESELNVSLDYLKSNGWKPNSPRTAVLLILCESHRLNRAAVVSCWGSWGDNVASGDIRDGTAFPSTKTLQSATKEVLKLHMPLLEAQSELLDIWHSALSTDCLPLSTSQEPHEDHSGQIDLVIPPLRFTSHKSAMDFAYYIVARVLQCSGPLYSITRESPIDIDCAYGEAEAWAIMLLRIAAGIDWSECVRTNVYTVGFTGLLLACLLHTRRPSIGIWIQQWLEQCLRDDAFEEANFPVFQILEAVRLVNRERLEGRDVLALFQTVNDEGGSGKFGSYHSQLITSLMVYGRCRSSGILQKYYRTI